MKDSQVRAKVRRLELPHKEKGIHSDILKDDYGADLEFLRIDVYNRKLLVKLLDKAMFEHRWADASGIVSTLLRSLPYWTLKQFFDSRPIFTIGLELLKKLEGTEPNSVNHKKLYNAMYSRQDMVLEFKRRQTESEYRYALQLYSSGDYEDAYNILRLLIDGPILRNDAEANLVYGLILHRMWYDHVSEREESSSEYSFGECEPALTEKQLQENTEQLPLRYGEDLTEDATSSLDPVCTTIVRKRIGKRKQRDYDAEGDTFWSKAMVKLQPFMDRRLFPVHVDYEPEAEYKVRLDSRAKEFLDKAIYHLHHAVVCRPEMTSACLPLVQLLLATGDVENAAKEIDICYEATRHALPLRLKALLLESLCERDSRRLAECYEKILERNPSSVDAVIGLAGLHGSGEYETKSLMTALANHLDVESTSIVAWRTLADCFFEISSCVKRKKESEVSAQELATIFLERNKLWSIKHFPHDKRSDDEAAQMWKVVTYKAACAAHLYGPKHDYVERACYSLRQLNKPRSLAVLESHRKQPLKLFAV